MGGLFVGLLAPNVFHAYYEFPIGLALCALIAAIVMAKSGRAIQTEPQSASPLKSIRTFLRRRPRPADVSQLGSLWSAIADFTHTPMREPSLDSRHRPASLHLIH